MAGVLVLAAVGGLAVRVGVTDEYASFVKEWMRWPVVVSGVLLVVLALAALLRPRSAEEDDHGQGSVAWLLVLPVVVGFVVQPPALGSYIADRRANEVSPSQYDGAVDPLPEGENDLAVSSFVARAAIDGGATLQDATVRLTGFVSTDEAGWYVSRLTIACCAADAAAFRVLVEDAEAPPEEEWVTVTGTWIVGTGTGGGDTPALAATDVTVVDKPKQPYE